MTIASPTTANAAQAPGLDPIGSAMKSGDLREAERLLRARLTATPADLAASAALADLLAGSDRGAEAISLLHRSLALAPGAHRLRLRLAGLHQQHAHYPAALAMLHQVPVVLRSDFNARVQEAALLGQLGRRDEEIVIYRALLVDQPRHAGLWLSLGNALNYAGHSADAVDALRRAAKLKPGFGEPWWSLANLKSFRFTGRDMLEMRKALRGRIEPNDALHFHFALGRALEQGGDYSRSFDHYQAGNGIRAAALSPAQMRITAFVDAACATFTPALFEQHGGGGCDAHDPIFVIGLQRSGSTLIEQILASHPQIEATSELLAMQHLWNELGTIGARHGRNIFAQIAEADSETFRKVGERYLARTRSFRSLDRPLFVDKLPANWLNVGLIRLALPNARIIDARRHPLACGLSNFKQHYATGVTFAYSLPAIGEFYADYLRLMRHFDAVQPGAILHVLNERLIDDPEGQVRRMLDYLGLPFEPSCLEFHRNTRAVHTPSAEQVRRPINRDGVDQWRHYEPWLGPLKKALGPALTTWDCD